MSTCPWEVPATGGPDLNIDATAIRQALALLADPAAAVEVGGPPPWGKPVIRPASNLDGLVAAVLGGGRTNNYIRLNPVAPDATACATDGDILRRRWLFLDIDPVKPAAEKNNPSSDAEHAATQRLAS